MSKARSYPTAKRSALGNTARPSPAWNSQVEVKREGFRPIPPTTGSKILVSQLPLDVAEPEVDELFSATIGPLFDVFVIYNKLQQSKGMAVVHFKSPFDARKARDRYNGKVIDGRVSLRIDYITDIDPSSLVNGVHRVPAIPAAPSRPRTLMERMSIQSRSPASHAPQPPPLITRTFEPPMAYFENTPTPSAPRALVYGVPKRIKKGPRRAKKLSRPFKSLADLDKEMEEYRRAKKLTLGSPGM